jgi:hypothetical protein
MRIDWLYHLRIFLQGLLAVLLAISFLLTIYYSQGVVLILLAIIWAGENIIRDGLGL